MTKEKFTSRIDALPVFDTHTHLKGEALAAQSFWDIGHYFWFIRELQSAGYPADPMALGPAQRIKAFWKAYQATTNTSMNWVVRRILSDLYGITLESEKDIRRADKAIRSTSSDPGWPATVCARTYIERIFTNVPADAPFPGLDGVAGVLPRMERPIKGWLDRVSNAGDQSSEIETISGDIDKHIAAYKEAGYAGIMTSDDPFDRLGERTHDPHPLQRTGNTVDAIGVGILHRLCQAVERHGMFIQFFLGIEKGYGTTAGGGGVPAYHGDRVLNLHGLFRLYQIPFELVLGDGLGNSDAINAARIFPNVHVGGMWWYNFRTSTYRQTMQQRFEALPSTKSELVVSDARCIEWCYGKIVLIKKLVADYLYDQIQDGWVDAEGAISIASSWLHDSAADLYRSSDA